ncbi:MAG: DMT family transporter, partial [Cyclobacteriaceae bacterium]|nr:DMT family transporter [Cyclobacteriaceae bacterium]
AIAKRKAGIKLPMKPTMTKGRHYRLLVIVGFIGSFIPAFLFAIAQTQIRSSMAGMLNALTPFFVMIIGAWFFKLRVKLGTGLGILLGFAGALLLLFTNATDGFGTLNAYALLVVLATILYGTNLNLIKYYLADLNAVTITSLSLVIVLPPAAVYLLGFTDFIEKLTTHPDGLLATGYITILGVMSTSLALILFNKLVQMTTPVFTSSVTYLIPVVAIVWGLFDGESLLMIHFIGMAVIISGVYLINYFKNTP